MQGQLTRPTDPAHIAYPGTPEELWWTGSDWSKPPAPTSNEANLAQLVQVYTAIRDARAAKKAAYEALDAEMEADQQKLRAMMLGKMNETGAKSIATGHGTVIRSEKLKPSAADWGAIWTWMKENDAPDLLERRLKTTFIKEFMENNDGALPPGVNVHREYEISVRRPTNKPSTTLEKD